VAAIILANLLMTKVVSQVFHPLFEPKLTWLFRDAEPPSVRIPVEKAPEELLAELEVKVPVEKKHPVETT
ncbi:MAG: hypothetical protein QOJ72_128, partial [Nocardioidaceae bacterium]|nr:hypothetical protein [Nocardioidaceae bacterium]